MTKHGHQGEGSHHGGLKGKEEDTKQTQTSQTSGKHGHQGEGSHHGGTKGRDVKE